MFDNHLGGTRERERGHANGAILIKDNKKKESNKALTYPRFHMVGTVPNF